MSSSNVCHMILRSIFGISRLGQIEPCSIASYLTMVMIALTPYFMEENTKIFAEA